MAKKNAKKRGKPFTAKNQPPPQAKRVKKRKTRVKEAIGLQSWESLGEYITSHGVEKFIKELKKLKGKAYISSVLDVAEFFKPKLSRTELTGKGGKELPPPNIIVQDEATRQALLKLKKK